MSEIGLRVSANYANSKMTLTLVKEEMDVGSITIDTEQASKVAAMALGTAAKAHDLSGNPPPYLSKRDPVSLTSVACSGWNIAPGRTPESLMLMFHFGEATLGIQIPREHAQQLGQRILTSAAGGSRQ